MISFDQFQSVDIQIGEILSAEKVAGADKLLRLTVSFGTKMIPAPMIDAAAATSEAPATQAVPDVRQIVSGIALYFPEPNTLVGVKCAFVTNLEPRVIRGLESQGMILAAGGGTEPFTLLRADPATSPGTKVK